MKNDDIAELGHALVGYVGIVLLAVLSVHIIIGAL